MHYNEKKNIFHFREYRDQTMTANGAASTSVYPQEDDDGNPVCALLKIPVHKRSDRI